MKANEVMIFDWVLFRGILSQETELHQIEADDFSGTELYFSALHPIKITGEILLANDFVGQPDVPEGLFNYVYNNGGQIVYVSPLPWDSFSIDANFNGRLSMSIQYVHELQHTLRLIGINDLADNFKIKEGGLQ